MWFLQNAKDAALHLSLPAGRDLVVGRKDCEVLIAGDQSISRKHAIIHVQDNNKQTSQVFLTDCKSKYGTVVNGKKLSTGEKVSLSVGDEIKFGQGPATGPFRLVFESLVFCCSSMAGAEKNKVKQLAKKLGGRVVSSWSPDCTHLVMNTLTVTIKVVSALSACRPIITPAWLDDAVKCLQEGKPLPNSGNYQPKVVDTNLGSENEVSFRPDFSRTKLFQDRTFYFLSEKQHASLHQCVQTAGAKCVLCQAPDSVPLEGLVVKESIVLAVDDKHLEQLTQQCREWVAKVDGFLKSHGLRAVLDSEIGFALLHKSIQKNCNPRSIGVEHQPALPAPSLSQMPCSMHIATQEPTSSHSNVTILAPNSEMSTAPHSAQSPLKQQHSDDTTQYSSVVKVKESFMLPPKSSPSKRKSTKPSKSNGAATSTTKPTSDSKNDGKHPLDDMLFDSGFDIPPAEVKSKLDVEGGAKRAPRTSTQIAPGPSGEPPPPLRGVPKSASSDSLLVDDSQPEYENKVVKDTSVLPGLKQRTSLHDVSIVGTRSQCEVLAPQSLESNASSFDASILAPNSLGTPRSQEKGSKKKDSLPDSLMMTKLFQGRRKKRGVEESTDGGAGVSERPTKKQCLEKESQIAGGEKEGERGMFAGLKSKRSRTKARGENGTTDHASDGPSVKKRKKSDDTAATSEDKDTQHFKEPSKALAKQSIRDRFSRPLDSVADISATQTTNGALSTPKKVPISPVSHSSTPFISTRRRTRTKSMEGEEAATENKDRNTTTMTQTNQTLTDTSTQSTAKPATQLVTPFTCLGPDTLKTALTSTVVNTRGKRSKVNTAADELWAEESSSVAEGEDPLGTQQCDGLVPTSRVYRPVYAEDGFIKARSAPRLQVSRMGWFANLGLIHSPPSGGSAAAGTGVSDERASSSQPAVHVEIERVDLLVVNHRNGLAGIAALPPEVEMEDGGGVKNFKKFRKVRNVADGGVPRFVALAQYVPESDNKVQDWEVREEEDPQTVPDESSQDIFRFTTTRSRR